MRNVTEIVGDGQLIYDQKIKHLVEPELNGKYLVVDIATGDYEIADTSLEAFHKIMERHPNGERYLVKIGFSAAYRLGNGIRRRI